MHTIIRKEDSHSQLRDKIHETWRVDPRGFPWRRNAYARTHCDLFEDRGRRVGNKAAIKHM